MTDNNNDANTTIKDIRDAVAKFRDKRGWVDEDPKDVALSLVLEAAELLEHFQWKSGEEVANEARLYGPICDELSDVLWWLLVLAERLDIDVARAFKQKMDKNSKKYPEKSFSEDMTSEDKMREMYRIKAKYRGSHPLAEETNEA